MLSRSRSRLDIIAVCIKYHPSREAVRRYHATGRTQILKIEGMEALAFGTLYDYKKELFLDCLSPQASHFVTLTDLASTLNPSFL
jgi:hypothetical protein